MWYHGGVEWLLLALVGGGGAYAAQRLRARRADRRQAAEDLESVRRMAEEDVTVLGEQLARLDGEVAGRALDDGARQDYQEALDAYEAAKWRAPRLREPDEISTLIDTVSGGRYSLACVQARVAGREVPERRVPCFFNPQHGPSTRDVEWTPPRHGTRMVPSCGQCAARVLSHQQPDLRTVKVGSRTVPYWEAGKAYLPYTRGHFALGVAAAGAGVAWSMQPPLDGGGYVAGVDYNAMELGDDDVGGSGR